MNLLFLGIGMVFVVEGLVLALAPSRIEDLLATLAALDPERRRVLGLVAVGAGVALVAVARWLGV